MTETTDPAAGPADEPGTDGARSTEDGHRGATYELGGPSPVSVRDVAAAASEVLGVDVPVERVDRQGWAASDGEGLDQREREWLLAMFAYYDRHGLPAGSLAPRCLLEREPTDVVTTLTRELA